jgi:cell division protease FtsH
MVCEFGMSAELGPRQFGEPSGEVFLGKEISRSRNYSEETAAKIDSAVQELLEEAHRKATDLLHKNRETLERVAAMLLERETLSGEDLELLVAGKELPPLEVVETEPENKDPMEGHSSPEKATTKPVSDIALDRPTEQPS